MNSLPEKALLAFSYLKCRRISCSKGVKALKNPMGPKSYWSFRTEIQIIGIKMKINCCHTQVSLLWEVLEAISSMSFGAP